MTSHSDSRQVAICGKLGCQTVAESPCAPSQGRECAPAVLASYPDFLDLQTYRLLQKDRRGGRLSWAEACQRYSPPVSLSGVVGACLRVISASHRREDGTSSRCACAAATYGTSRVPDHIHIPHNRMVLAMQVIDTMQFLALAEIWVECHIICNLWCPRGHLAEFAGQPVQVLTHSGSAAPPASISISPSPEKKSPRPHRKRTLAEPARIGRWAE
jgi:hypothetical protein